LVLTATLGAWLAGGAVEAALPAQALSRSAAASART